MYILRLIEFDDKFFEVLFVFFGKQYRGDGLSGSRALCWERTGGVEFERLPENAVS